MNNLNKIGESVFKGIQNANTITQNNNGKGEGVPFSEMLKSSLNEVNQLQNEADKAIQELTTGGTKDIHQTMLALKKADISLQLMIQVRNKIVDAYQEIMRMSV